MRENKNMAGKALSNISPPLIVLSVLLFLLACLGGCKDARASGSTVTGRAMKLPGSSAVPFVRVLVNGDEATRLKVTDSNGSYTMSKVPVGSYIVTFARFGFQLYTQSLVIDQDDETYIVDLAQLPAGTDFIGGTISSLGEAVPGAEVWLIFEDGGLVSTITNPDGLYAFSGLPSGNYVAVAMSDDLVSEAVEDVYIGFEGTRVLDFDLEPVVPFNGATMSGSVTNINGQGLDEAYVGIFPSGTVPSLYMIAISETLSSGSGYTIADIPAGTYTVVCTRSGYLLESDVLIAEEGNSYTLNFELDEE